MFVGSTLQITVQSLLFVKKGIFGGRALRNFVRAGWLLCVSGGNRIHPLDTGSGIYIWVGLSFFPWKERMCRMVGWRNIGLKQIIWLWGEAPHSHWRTDIWARRVQMVSTGPKQTLTYVTNPKATKAMQYGRAEEIKGLTSVLGLRRMLMHFLFFVVNILLLFFSLLNLPFLSEVGLSCTENSLREVVFFVGFAVN